VTKYDPDKVEMFDNNRSKVRSASVEVFVRKSTWFDMSSRLVCAIFSDMLTDHTYPLLTTVLLLVCHS